MGEPLYRAHALVCGGTGCSASDSHEVYDALTKEVSSFGLSNEVRIISTGCRGFCAMGPVMMIYPEGIFYCQVKPEDVREIVQETFIKGRVVERLAYQEPNKAEAIPHYKDIPFYENQVRIALRNCGLINPEVIDEYIANDGYQALGKAVTEMQPAEVVKMVKDSGLRGRGGAGFLTGLKWELCARAAGDQKYLICNADEGDPGAFMDRSILEGDPHTLIEGMAIAGYGIGASEGYVYCRAEYPLAIARLETAIEQAKEYGFLGDNIMGSDFSFNLFIKEGAGAFVCGEETALIASIEGKRGEPRPKPPFPAVSGLWGKPTNINNVETWANVPSIVLNGVDWFAGIGTEKSKGTKVFALTGKINNTGLVEVPMGITLGDIVFDIGGGIPKKKRFKAVQTGGPLGGCLPADQLNTPVDYDSLTAAGATMGSGGMIVVDQDTCMVEFSKFFLDFATAESCGQCTPCRAGGKQLLEVLTRITEGKGTLEDLDKIDDISKVMADGSLCALGKLTPSPVLSTLRYFKDEYMAHILDKKCPAGACKELTRAKCVSACPAGVDVPSYLALVADGKYDEALEVHRQRNPFPSICGRVCPAFCEARCRRGEVDEAVSIRQVKRFMGDQQFTKPWTPTIVDEPKAEKVAVVGSGPAGLTAALRLAQWGYKVKIFEALPVAGGMMAVGIPSYRLPEDVLNTEIDNIKRAGVEIELNKALGRDFTIDSLKEDGYSAVVLATGAHKSRKLGLHGENPKYFLAGTDFLRDVALGAGADLKGKKVAVVGGGDVAIDAARVALRKGANEVHIVYRRTRDDMPAQREEVEAAEEEGIRFHFLVDPVEVTANGSLSGLVLQRQVLGEFDSNARRKPVPLPGAARRFPHPVPSTDYFLSVDVVIPAIGQMHDASSVAGERGLQLKKDGTYDVERYLSTNIDGVFAAGDSVSGPATLIQAVAQGNQAAVSVYNYLTGESVSVDDKLGAYADVPLSYNMEEYAEAPRVKNDLLDARQRIANFDEVEQTLPEAAVREECKRCLRCDLE